VSENEPFPAKAGLPERFTVRVAQRVVVTWVLLGINVAVFAWMLLRGVDAMHPSMADLLAFGANHAPDTVSGQWWRLLTSTFLHVGVVHLAFNMWALRLFGPTTEKFFGGAGFLAVYVLSGIGASLASGLWNPTHVSAGASGSIFGMLGALVAFFLAHKRAMPLALFQSQIRSMLFLIAINVMLGITIPQIDNAAHLGGLATGFVAARCLDRDPLDVPSISRKQAMRVALLVLALVGAGALLVSRVSSDPEAGASRWLSEAVEAEEREDWAAVRALATRAIEAAPKSARAYDLRALAEFESGEGSAALIDFGSAIEMDPDLEHARRMRGLLRFQRRDHERALEDLGRAIALDPSRGWTFLQRGHALFSLARFDAALRDFQSSAGLDESLAVEAQIYAALCRVRLGLLDKAGVELESWFSVLRPAEREPWIAAVVKFIGGKTKEEEFLDTLPKLDASDHANLRRRATFLAAEMRAGRGDPEGAKELWRRTGDGFDGNPANFDEVLHAVDELARLGGAVDPRR
jgi:membrane associated rhomboid family serine protease/lipoprotein NlpI